MNQSKPNIVVYELKPVFDDPRFGGFASLEKQLSLRPRKREEPLFVDFWPDLGPDMPRFWKQNPLAPIWGVLPVQSTELARQNDYPCIDLMIPAFSPRAIEVLGSMLREIGELLPLGGDGEGFFAFNLLNVIDALDIDQSKLSWTCGGPQASKIYEHHFFQDKLIGQVMFKIYEKPSSYYVTNVFKEAVEKAGLRGFTFKKAWPLSADESAKVDQGLARLVAAYKAEAPDLLANLSPACLRAVEALPSSPPPPPVASSPPKTILKPLDDNMMSSIVECAQEAMAHHVYVKSDTPNDWVEAIDQQVLNWQRNDLGANATEDEAIEYALHLGSLWGQKMVEAFGWRWMMAKDPTVGTNLAVVSPDDSLVIYPIWFVQACLAGKDIDCTIMLSWNLLRDDKTVIAKPGDLFHYMFGVHRIVPV